MAGHLIIYLSFRALQGDSRLLSVVQHYMLNEGKEA